MSRLRTSRIIVVFFSASLMILAALNSACEMSFAECSDASFRIASHCERVSAIVRVGIMSERMSDSISGSIDLYDKSW